MSYVMTTVRTAWWMIIRTVLSCVVFFMLSDMHSYCTHRPTISTYSYRWLSVLVSVSVHFPSFFLVWHSSRYGLIIPSLHDTTGCQTTGWTTGWTTSWMFVYTMYRLDNRLYCVNKHPTGWTTSYMNSTCLIYVTHHATGWMKYANEPYGHDPAHSGQSTCHISPPSVQRVAPAGRKTTKSASE